jgi:hypothetical protein
MGRIQRHRAAKVGAASTAAALAQAHNSSSSADGWFHAALCLLHALHAPVLSAGCWL